MGMNDVPSLLQYVVLQLWGHRRGEEVHELIGPDDFHALEFVRLWKGLIV